MKYGKTICAALLSAGMAACTTQPSKPLNEVQAENTDNETAETASDTVTEPQPVQLKEPNAEYTLPEGTVRLYIPSEGWSVSVEDDGLKIVSEDYEETVLNIYFDDHFATCGTGLEQKRVTINDTSAISGCFDGKPWWDYTVFGEFGGMQLVITKTGLYWDSGELNRAADDILHSIIIH